MSVADLAATIVSRSGLPALVRATIARRRPSILLYHDPTPQVLDAHLRYLGSRYSFVTLDAIVEALRQERLDDLPPRALAITIDDGHRGNAALVDVFRAHGVVPTIYINTQIVGTTRHYWFLDVSDPEPFKRLANGARLAALAEQGFEQTEEHGAESRQALGRDEILAMRDHIAFGGHTRFHPILPACTTEEATQEIAGCREEAVDLTGRPCAHFAYPNGDNTARDRRLVHDAGFQSGRSTRIGWVGPRTDVYRLPILGVPDGATVTRLAADLTGVTSWLAAGPASDLLAGLRARRGAAAGG